MQSTIFTPENLITKLFLLTSKLLNIETNNYQVKRVCILNKEDIYNANIKFVEMMNIKL
jgi:hypothetical protein